MSPHLTLAPPVNMNQVIGSHDVLFITLDTLRYDVAQELFLSGQLPTLAAHLPPKGWECRHTPGSFTYAAHQAFFAGFLPTPARPGRHPRLFATAFHGSETTAASTCVFPEDNIMAGLKQRGYHTVCIGGVGFFNRQTSLGSVLPNLFEESHWHPSMGVTARRSTERQVALACQRLHALSGRVFLFLNVSALHHPNYFYLDLDARLPTSSARRQDSLASHAAALRYVDAALAPLFDACARRGPCFVIICADHGTAYGEEGYVGHRIALPCVWNVPYAHFFLSSPLLMETPMPTP